MARNKYWVSPHQDNWKVQKQGATKPHGIYATKHEAIVQGKYLAKENQPSQLLIQKRDGTIETEHTYGNDPYPPPG